MGNKPKLTEAEIIALEAVEKKNNAWLLRAITFESLIGWPVAWAAFEIWLAIDFTDDYAVQSNAAMIVVGLIFAALVTAIHVGFYRWIQPRS